MNVIDQLKAFNAGRDPERLLLKYQKMRASPFGFLRATCHLFYDRLPTGGVFKSAPPVWVCGDLHLENFGSYKGNNRLAYFDLNDFDESALAPASWDLVRMLASLQVGAASLGFAKEQARSLCRIFLQSYAAALAGGKSYWIESETAHGIIRHLMLSLRERQRAQFLDTRTTLKRRRRVIKVDGQKALAATNAQRTAVLAFMAKFAATQADPAFFEVQDVARRIAGTGSLGLDRFAVLVQGKSSPGGNYLLDLKACQPSSVAPHVATPQPAWKSEAHRVVEVQRRMQAVPPAMLQPVRFNGKPYVLRELQPHEDRVTLDHSGNTPQEVGEAVGTMGQLVAWAQLRSAGRDGSATADELIGFALRSKWQGKLLDASADCAARVKKDAATFNAAFDAGAFNA
ncbi:MAG: DUF2252 domain-containing protein [Burkholderiaceae bacterium]|nr:DUF2252 domain-containing protein [Burkholderiaceae bacterium]